VTYSLTGVFDGTTLNSVVAIGRGSGTAVNLELKFGTSDLANLTMSATTTEILKPSQRIRSAPECVVVDPKRSKSDDIDGEWNVIESGGKCVECECNWHHHAAVCGPSERHPRERNDSGNRVQFDYGIEYWGCDCCDKNRGCDGCIDVGQMAGYLMGNGTVPVYVGIYGTTYPARGQMAGTVKLDWSGANAVSAVNVAGTSASDLEWKRPASGVCTRRRGV